MRRISSTTFLLLFSVSAHAETVQEKSCILEAATNLPSIPGLSIVASRTKDLPLEMQTRLQLQRERYKGRIYALKPGFLEGKRPKVNDSEVGALLVEMDVKAAAQEANYIFMCYFSSSAPTVVHPLGLAH